MYFNRWKSNKQSNVNIAKYIIDWNHSPSKEQQILQDFLYIFWKNKVILAEFRIPGSLFRIDILNLTDKIAIEYSPESSHDYNPYFHKNRTEYVLRVKADLDKIDWMKKSGFKPIEVTSDDLPMLSKKLFIDKFQIYL